MERLEPSPEERGPGERWSPFFKGKEGDGDDFRRVIGSEDLILKN